MSLRAHFLQHVPFEGLGNIATWLAGNNYTVSSTALYKTPNTTQPPFPSLDDVDLLIVLGGPMSINDEQDRPWLRDEKLFIREAIDANKAILGVCLGSQLIASAMGSTVYPNTYKEIGWYPLNSVALAKTDNTLPCFDFPGSFTAFHWHGETFDLPENAILLAHSEGCRNQAFQLKNNVIALQFHLETTAESAQQIVHHCGDEIIEGRQQKAPYIQSKEEILETADEYYSSIQVIMNQVLDFLTRDL